MKYLMLMYCGEGRWTPEEREECMIGCFRICDQLAANGKFLDSAPLQPVSTAATVRVRDGRPMITDGPFAETTEQLGGYFLMELEDLDEAIAVVSSLPPLTKGAAEIRPVFDLEGLPPTRALPSDSKLKPFMLLCYDDEAYWKDAGAAVQRAAMAEAAGMAHELSEKGQYLTASPLHHSSTATCVRIRDGKKIITDGPFVETREVLGGFYLILAASREDALKYAARHPGARVGSVEVRPLFDYSDVRKKMSKS